MNSATMKLLEPCKQWADEFERRCSENQQEIPVVLLTKSRHQLSMTLSKIKEHVIFILKFEFSNLPPKNWSILAVQLCVRDPEWRPRTQHVSR